MFNLEEEIQAWRRELLRAGIRKPEVLDELAAHLRDQTILSINAGTPAEAAFKLAVSRLGNPASMQSEFNKLNRAERAPVSLVSSVWLAAAGGLALFLMSRRLGWLLSAHIFSVTAGYLAAFAAGAVGIYYIALSWSSPLTPGRERSLAQAARLFLYVAVGLVAAGWLFGMFWSGKHLDQALNWDPRAVGVLVALLWLIIMAAVQLFRRASDRATLLLGILGNLIVGLAWFGAGILARNPKGFGVARHWPLEIFLGLHLLVFLLGIGSAKPARWREV